MNINKQKLEDIIKQIDNSLSAWAGQPALNFEQVQLDRAKLMRDILSLIKDCLEESPTTKNISTPRPDGQSTTYMGDKDFKVSFTP